MSRTNPYLTLWRIPGAPVLLVGGVVARLGQGVTVVAWILLVRAVTGSYATAALVSGLISLATASTAPVAGRLLDRYGSRRVLRIYAAVYATTQLLLLAAVLARLPLLVVSILALAAGATLPSVSPALRAAWSSLTSEASGRSRSRTTAMAAESTLFELVFVVGPLVLSAFILLAPLLSSTVGSTPEITGPAAALVAAALCGVAGTFWICAGTAFRQLSPHTSRQRTRGWGPLRIPGFGYLLACAAGIAVSFGASPVVIAVFAEQHHGGDGAGVTGVLIAVWSLGSAAGGVWFGTLQLRTAPDRQFLILLAGLGAGYLSWLLAPSSLVFGGLLFLTGAVIAPAMTVMASIVAQLTPESMLTEAYTWLTAVNMAAAAAGSALAGVMVEATAGYRSGFLTCAIAVSAAAALTTGLRQVLAAPARVPA